MTTEEFDSKLRGLVAEFVRDKYDEGVMVGSFALVLEFIDTTGAPCLIRMQSDDIPYWRELGLLEAAALEIRKSVEVA